MSNPETVVVVPTYNEVDNLDDLLSQLLALPVGIGVIVVDDNSPDGTGDIVDKWQQKEPRVHLLRRKGKQGLGTAYIAGFKWCLERHYDHIFEMDCDFSHDPHDLKRMYAELVDGHCDLVIGSRYVNNVVNVVNWPMGRVLLSYFASAYVRFITRMKVADDAKFWMS